MTDSPTATYRRPSPTPPRASPAWRRRAPTPRGRRTRRRSCGRWWTTPRRAGSASCPSSTCPATATGSRASRSEKGAKLAQNLGQLQPFIAVFPQECMGQLASFGPTQHLSRSRIMVLDGPCENTMNPTEDATYDFLAEFLKEVRPCPASWNLASTDRPPWSVLIPPHSLTQLSHKTPNTKRGIGSQTVRGPAGRRDASGVFRTGPP
jgi:hypothetical protein